MSPPDTRTIISIIIIFLFGSALLMIPHSYDESAVSAASDSQSCDLRTLRAALSLPVGFSPRAVATADFDHDGKMDFVAGNAVGGITIYAGNGDGTFQPRRILLGSGTPSGIAAADFNRDGRIDFAVADQSRDLDVFINLNNRTFAAPVNYAAGTGATGIVAADFDGDGLLDLIVGNIFSNDLSLLSGRGDGTFKTAIVAASSVGAPERIVIGDFNNDNRPDLTTNGWIILNQGGGNFGLPVAIGFNSLAVAAADFNSDGKIDLAISDLTNVSFIFGDGTGKFAGRQICCERPGASGLAADFTGDGKTDLALAFPSDQNGRISLLAGDAAGGFTPVNDYGAGRTPYTLAGADFNNDGRLDLVAVNRDTDDASVLLNRGGGDFQAARTRTFARAGTSAAGADFNRDGRDDLIATDGTGKVILSFGTGHGSFDEPREILTPGAIARSGHVADFTGDGIPDLALTYAGQGGGNPRAAIFIGNGFEVVPLGISAPVGGGVQSLTSAHLDGDGKLDLIVASRTANRVSLLFGDGAGGFSRTRDLEIEGGPGNVAAGDFDRDGKVDLALALTDARSLRFLYGDGSGEFNRQANTPIGLQPLALVSRDLDGDGTVEMVISYQDAPRLSVWRGGNFSIYEVGSKVREVLITDLDGDGRVDLAALKGDEEFSLHRVAILRNDGPDGFTLTREWTVANGLYLAAGDFNGDGAKDLAAVCTGGSTFGSAWLMPGECAALRPLANVSAASFRGESLSSGAIAAAFGQGLSLQTEIGAILPLPTKLVGTQVRIRDAGGNERLAPLFFVSSNQINYLLPPETPFGEARVTIHSGDGTVSRGVVTVAPVAPGLFAANSDGQGIAAAQALHLRPGSADRYESTAVFDPQPGRFVAVPIDLSAPEERVFLLLFGTGWRGRSALTGVSVNLGGANGEVSYAGPQGVFVGLDQINVELPRSLIGRKEIDVTLTVDGLTANTVRISIK